MLCVQSTVWHFVSHPAYGTARQDMDDDILMRMRFAWCIPNERDTHSEYAIVIAFPLHQLLLEWVSVLGYVYFACLVNLLKKISTYTRHVIKEHSQQPNYCSLNVNGSRSPGRRVASRSVFNWASKLTAGKKKKWTFSFRPLYGTVLSQSRGDMRISSAAQVA